MGASTPAPKSKSPTPPKSPAGAIAVADADAAADEGEFDTEAIDTGSISDASTSVNSSLLEHSFESGRRYHKYRNGRYPIPNDDVEQNRDDMKHAMMLELTDGKLFFAPIGDSPQKIVDLGTGTGIWAIDVADQYPSAQVLGIDLSPIQPVWVPPNCSFIVDDIEDEWLHGSDWDLVHMRCISPWLKDEPKLLKQAFDHMKTGAWIEIQEFDGRVNCDDGTIDPTSPLKKFYDLVPVALANFGMKFNVGEDLQEPLESAGFVNVTHKVLKVPFGSWAKDKTLRLVGHYCQLMMTDLMTAMAAKPFKKLENMNDVEISLLLTAAKKCIADPSQHGYIKYFFWTAQKPEGK